jgi:threonine/homoserine/homoserine lactone efflux protein
LRRRGRAQRVGRGVHGDQAGRRGLPGLARPAGHPPRRRARAGRPRAQRLAFRQGLFCNLLNPKAGIFFTALLPQFVSPQDPALVVSLLMTAIAAAASLAWLSVYATVVPRAGDVLRRPRVRRALDRATGVVLIGLGVRLALTRR